MGTPPENVTPPPAPAAAPPGRASVTPPQIAIVVGVLVVLLVAVYFLFLRGGGEEETAAPPPGTSVPAPEPEPVETIDPDDGDSPVETFEVFAPRDPFDSLISASGTGGDTTGGDTTGGDTDGDGVIDGGDTDGDGTIDGGDTNGSGTGDGSNGSNVDGHRVKVIDVFRQNGRDRAQVQVDGTVYTVDEGEDFATNFRLVSASGQCATMLFGDDEFTLCEGEEILK